MHHAASMLIRPAEPGDVDVLHQFIVDLAEAEDFPGPVTARPQDVAAALFGPRSVAEAVVAMVDGAAAGFALFGWRGFAVMFAISVLGWLGTPLAAAFARRRG